MKKLAILLLGLLALAACRQEPAEPAYVVQVSLGAWNAPQYTADEIIKKAIRKLKKPSASKLLKTYLG